MEGRTSVRPWITCPNENIESTALSQSLSEQGIKIRIRKDVRNRPRALFAPLPPSGTANEDGAADGAPGEGEADGPLPRARAKRKGAPSKKPGAGKPNPRKRARPNPEAPSGIGNTGNDTPSVPPFPTFNASSIAQDYSHLPPPSIPGGVPINVPYHPDILVRHDEQPAPLPTAARDSRIQSAVPVGGTDQNVPMAYIQPSPHSLPNTQAAPNASAQPQAYSRQWAHVPQPQLPVRGQRFPHSQVPPQVIGAPSYSYSTQPTAINTISPSHIGASHPMHPYSHVPIPTEYTHPPSASTNPMRPLHFPPGPIPSPQPLLSPPQGGLDYRQHAHSHTQQPPLVHSHQRVPSFGQPAQPPQGCTPYAAYQAQAPGSQSHSGYSMSPVGMSGPPTLTSPTIHDDISTLTPSRSTALPSSATYIPLSSAALESPYRPPPPAHPHGGGGAYPPGPGPTPPGAALQGHGYTTQQQTGYEGYRKSSIFLGGGNLI